MKKQTFALITGASSGLGTDFADLLAGQGYNLILVARRKERLEQVAEKARRDHGVSVEVISADLGRANAAQSLYDQVAEKGLEVEVLINNAGFGIYGLFPEIDMAAETQMMHLNMITLVQLTKLFLVDMKARDKGYILQVSSIGAFQATPTYASYAATKSFVLQFGEAVNYELKDSGVKHSVLCPGITATEFLAVSGQKPTLYQRIAMMASREVCRTGLKAMFKGKPSIVPGLMNKLSAFSVRLMPRRFSAFLAYRLMKTPEADIQAKAKTA